MKNIANILTWTTLLLLAAVPHAFGDDERVTAPWKRGVKRVPRTAIDTRPPAELPSTLRRSAPGAEKTARDLTGLERRVVSDAREFADEAADRRGRRSYFRVGFRQGLLEALNDDRLGRRDFRQGVLDGETDREARRLGRGIGSDAAIEIALGEAESAVAAQFRDLSLEPAFDPSVTIPAWSAPPVRFDVPDVDDLLSEYPFTTYGPRGRDGDGFLADWEWTADRLRRSTSYNDVYDRQWADGARAYERWVRNPSNARLIRGLSSLERNDLRALFIRGFENRLDRLADTRLSVAWERGLDRGWDYGRFIREELEYREGFARGFRQQAGLMARTVFRSAYPREFKESYTTAFDRWSTSAVPVIGDVALTDGNDDGVFEPGERLRVDVELINLGGASGRFEAGVTGRALSLSDTTSVSLPRRSSVVRRALLETGIDETIRPRTNTELVVRLGDETTTVGLRVARPLEWIRGSLRANRDNLAGRVEVEVEVRNISRRTLDADATLSGPAGVEIAPLIPLPAIRANDRVAVRFELDGLSPLDLIAGRVGLDLLLVAEGVEQDRTTTKLGETATDLSSRDLPRLVRRFADRGATAVEAAQVRELVLLRLRADWRAAVRASGNPYKRDYRSGSGLTALGELVSLSRASARSDLLQGLGSDVLVLSKDLPGPHPLLRKYVRRLAQRLP
jgi:hypothetical protein